MHESLRITRRFFGARKKISLVDCHSWSKKDIWLNFGLWFQAFQNLLFKRILNNIKWYEEVNIIKFLSSFGKYLRMGDLLSRKQIVDRLASKDGINYTEFSYQVFQAYDWLHLHENHKCNIQVNRNRNLFCLISVYLWHFFKDWW